MGFCLVANEDALSIKEVVDSFVKCNSCYDKTSVIVTDKDELLREALHKEFVNTELRLCKFHTLQTFRREITTSKMGLCQAEREEALEILQNLVHAKNPEEYDTIRAELNVDKFQLVNNYMAKKWDSIREQWVYRLGENCGLWNTTNNRMEALNNLLKQVIRKNGNLLDFFRDRIVVVVQSTRIERIQKALSVATKAAVSYEPPAELKEFCSVLTPYAMSVVVHQFKLGRTMELPKVAEETGISLEYHGQTNYVTESACQCVTFIQLQLPCKHILAFRLAKNKGLF